MKPAPCLLLSALTIAAGCTHDPARRPHATPTAVTPAPADAAPPSTPEVFRARDTTAWLLPVPARGVDALISRFGDPRGGGSRTHEGVDIAAPHGSQVVAPVAGRVLVSGVRSLGGNVVVVAALETDHELVFSHLERRLVRAGDRVRAGEPIGTVGTTGNARGGPPHLHYEVHRPSGPIDPLPLLRRATPPGPGRSR